MAYPVYLFTGPEVGERNDEIARIKAGLRKKNGSCDEFLFYCSDVRVSDVIAQLQNGSLFSASICIVLRGAEQIKTKEDIGLISSLGHSECGETALLILVSDDTAVDQKLEKVIPKENRKIFWEMFEDRKVAWLESFFKRNNYVLGPGAADSILDMVENNTEELRSECSRFFLCFPPSHVVSVTDVEQVLVHNREVSSFTLFDVMSVADESPESRLDVALSMLQRLLLSKGANPVMIIAGLTSCFRRLSLWHAIHAAGPGPDDFTLRINGFSSRIARTQYGRAARVWNSSQCAAVVSLLARTDIVIRSSGAVQSDTMLMLMLYEIIIKSGVACLHYESDWLSSNF
jgi:DNA polymerase III subunit delta